MTQVVIISVPYTEPIPIVAPALLKACLTNAGISAAGFDFSIKLMAKFCQQSWWPSVKNLISLGVYPEYLPRRALVDILKFTKKQLLEIKKIYNPEYIGLSIFTNESINFSYLLIPLIRKHLPGVKIMLGGRGLELTCGITNIKHYKKYWQHGMADVVVVGDSETAIVEVVKNNISGIYYAKQQTKEDLENIPISNWDDYDFNLYKQFESYTIKEDVQEPGDDPRHIAVTSSKGCVRQCTFCDVADFWPEYLYRDGAKVAQEIINIYEHTGLKKFRFTDNLMNGSISNYRRMNELLAEKIPNTIRYRGYAIFRPKSQMPDYDFEIAKKAGCYSWSIGVESGSERLRFEMRKKFTNDDMDHSITQLHKNNIKQNWLMMVGYPTETHEDYLESEELLRRYAHLAKNSMIRIGLTPTFMLLQNSPLLQDPELVKQLGLNFDPTDNLSRYFWTADVNPENTFDVRADRWRKLMQLTQELGYDLHSAQPTDMFIADLENNRKIYDEYKQKNKHKKMFPIHQK